MLKLIPVAVVLFIPITIFFLVCGILGFIILRLLGQRKASFRCVCLNARLLSRTLLFLCGVRVHVNGETSGIKEINRSGRCVCYVANHTSCLDILLMYGCLGINAGFVAKKSISYMPIINVWTLLLKCVYIDRKDVVKSLKAIRTASDRIKDGYSMFVFPEGTRSKTGEVGKFHPLSFRIATESGCPVVPISICGLRCACEDRKHFFQVSDCYVSVGSAVNVPESSDRDKVFALIQSVDKTIRDNVSEMNGLKGQKNKRHTGIEPA